MELVLVRDLCGTFCFSMQFVVFMDLIGTVVLPIAICLTVALIINSIIKPPHSFEEAIPLMLLGCVLGLPAFLILITTRKAIYVAWMVIYLFALPIWNFVLPVYSFWHFDDFSWGETRKVEGEVVDKSGHSAETAVFDGTTVPLRRWDDWERSRLRKLRREEKRRRQMEKMHGRGFYGEDGTLPTPDRGFARDYDSDCGSVVSSEEDMWGGDIGGYDENNPAYPPPPQTITADQPRSSYGGPVLGLNDMAALLDQGFEEPAPAQTRPDRNAPSPLYRGYQAAQTRSPTGSGSGKSSPIGYVPEQYAALTRNSPVMGAQSTAIESNSHAGSHTRQRSTGGVQNLPGSPDGGNYGPLGPLDNGGNFNYGKRI
jgi:chitin synthase